MGMNDNPAPVRFRCHSRLLSLGGPASPAAEARVIVLIGASCTIGTGAGAFWVGIAFGAISSVTGFPSEAARSMIRPEGFPARLGPPSTPTS